MYFVQPSATQIKFACHRHIDSYLSNTSQQFLSIKACRGLMPTSVLPLWKTEISISKKYLCNVSDKLLPCKGLFNHTDHPLYHFQWPKVVIYCSYVTPSNNQLDTVTQKQPLYTLIIATILSLIWSLHELICTLLLYNWDKSENITWISVLV